MKYTLKETNKFKKDVKRCVKRGLPLIELKKVMALLKVDGQLPPQYRQHKLSGNYDNCWECHIKADWLLVWEEHEYELVLVMTDTGSHADLF